MDIERGALEILFNKVSLENIIDLSNSKKANDMLVSKTQFLQYANHQFPCYTNDEVNLIYDYVKETIKSAPSHKNNIFWLLFELSSKLLEYDEEEPLCQYEQVLRWRDISFQLGQDIFTTAYIAKNDVDFRQTTNFFAWRPIIRTNNRRLHQILSQGMAENHFHLNGSSQIFPLSWISLMNHLKNREKTFQGFKRYLTPKFDESLQIRPKMSLQSQCILAADIRQYLFGKIMGDKVQNIRLMYGLNSLRTTTTYIKLQADDIQSDINVLKIKYGQDLDYGCIDYAFHRGLTPSNNNNNRALAGEREFLYQCFTRVYNGAFDTQDKYLFYAYLVIKNTFRQELIQTNRRVGFSNFAEYQNRKSGFIEPYRKYNHEQVRLAMNSTLQDQNIQKMEARITPRATTEDTLKFVRLYENAIHKHQYSWRDKLLSQNITPNLDNYFYVLHFPKSKDKTKTSNGMVRCRHHTFRKKINFQAQEIGRIFNLDNKIKYLIKGIDTCSNENDCRPEVFAMAFRYLRNFNIITAYDKPERNERKPVVLRATNHAGEDFFDIIDGLRAIDETVLFYNMKRADRLGHALALGIDPTEYYCLKNYTIILTKQDRLDDIAWILYKADELKVSIDVSLKQKLENEFYELLHKVYGGSINEKVTLREYQQAWMLRGDDPELYKGRSININLLEAQSRVHPNLIFQRNLQVSDSIRKNTVCYELMKSYHYRADVRKKGEEKYTYKVSMEYVQLAKDLQNGLQMELVKRGIGIECNPSSNYLIGTINKYEDHPIFKFNSNKLSDASNTNSLCISINTDDQGVFDTLLENEYALLAAALEKKQSSNGEQVYSVENIYEWIDMVRKMGLSQSFG